MTKYDLIRQVTKLDFEKFSEERFQELTGLGIITVTDYPSDDNPMHDWDVDVLKQMSEERLQKLLDGESLGTDSITAQHFIADKVDYDRNGDLRQRVWDKITVDINPAIEELPKKFGRLYCDWYHFDLAGVLTEDKFHENLDTAIEKFAKQVDQHENPFRPVRFHTQPPTQYGIGYIDWLGGDCPFDLRVIVQFANFVEPTTKITTPGLHFFLCTLVEWDGRADELEPLK